METNQPKEEIKTSECGLSNESDRLFTEVYLKLTASEARVKELEEVNKELDQSEYELILRINKLERLVDRVKELEEIESKIIKHNVDLIEENTQLKSLVEERTKLIKEAWEDSVYNCEYPDVSFESWSKEKGI